MNVDNLSIGVQTNASRATQSLQILNDRLARISTSLNTINTKGLANLSSGVRNLTTAMTRFNENTKTADFSRLAKNLSRINQIDTSQFNSLAIRLSSVSKSLNSIGTLSTNSQNIGTLASNLSKLGNKGVTNAITNLPLLSVELKKLLVELSKAPTVSSNVIQMTNALASLASQGSKVGVASKAVSSGITNIATASNRSHLSFRSLVAAFGTFYANCFLLIRGLKALWSSITKTADYIESYNYFNVALGKIGSDFQSEFEKNGYKSAESYASSFERRLKEKLSGLSGIKLEVGTDGKGMLRESGLKNLGLNINEITQYASQLASVTNSVGQTGENSIKIASSFTKLAGDISSLFNVDYSDVAKNLQSGLIGQSRALYKYGIDITNATLQTYAYGAGIEKAVSDMSQMEKMQLRVLAILDQSRVSWGDLANTLSSPSNQIRILKTNMSELATMIGQLFVPLLTKVLPVINGITVALKRLVSVIASLFGIEIDMSQFGNGFDEGAEGAEDIEDSMEGASKASKKLKQNLLGMDELNVINSDQNTGGTGGGGGGAPIDLSEQIEKATEEYEKAWEEAYKRMQDRITKIADIIDKALEPVKGILANLFSGNFFAAGYGVGELAKGILDWITNAIASVDWKEVGSSIGKFLNGIDWEGVWESIKDLISQIITAFFDFTSGLSEENPLAGFLLGFTVVAGIIKKVIGFIGKIVAIGTFIYTKIVLPIVGVIDYILALLGGITTTLGTIMTVDIGTLFAFGTLAEIATGLFAGLLGVIAAAFAGFNFGKWLGELIFGDEEGFYEDFKFFGDGGFFDVVFSDLETTFTALKTMWNDFVNSDFHDWIFEHITTPIMDFSTKGVLFDFVASIPKAIEQMWDKATEIWQNAQDWLFTNLTEPFLDNVINGWEKMGDAIDGIWNGIKTFARSTINSIIGIVEQMLNGMIDGINAFFLPLNGFIELASTMFGIEGLKPISLFDNVSIPRISGYYNGGYPKSYSMFMAGENGVPELLGTVGGKTAVASGAEITGIREEIRNTANEEMLLLRQQNQLLQGILEKEFGISRKAIYKAVVEENSKNKNTFKPYFATN